MALFSKREIRRLVHPHYLINMFLALSFIVLKNLKPVCGYIFKECDLDYRETEILFFTLVVIIFRTRKQGAVNFLPYISTACMLGKIGNVVLFFYADPLLGVIFVVASLLHLLLLPEPSYQGPENITYFNHNELQNELSTNKKTVWLIEFYTAWNPTCIDFANAFAELSAKYGADNLKFGKIDLARNEDSSHTHKINTHALSKQLPTLILFKNGQEYKRVPDVTTKNKIIPFSFTFENVVSTFDLNNLYNTCKSAGKPSTKNDSKDKKD
ncbi:Thioredoxin-related transmembrane protein 2 -like protein [Halotydeus destructor]|nr:Thioredoxin-related transmembrane protein 2 -like protein [Halotydeus destructor]